MTQLSLFDLSMRWNSRRAFYRPSQEPIDPSQFSVEPIGDAAAREFVTNTIILDPTQPRSRPTGCSRGLVLSSRTWSGSRYSRFLCSRKPPLRMAQPPPRSSVSSDGLSLRTTWEETEKRSSYREPFDSSPRTSSGQTAAHFTISVSRIAIRCPGRPRQGRSFTPGI